MLELEQEIQAYDSWDPGVGGKVVPGVYEARIETVVVQTSQSGHPKLNFKYQIVEGDYLGSIAFGDRSLHPNALPFFRGMLDVVSAFATGRTIDEQKLVGRYLKIQVIEYDKADSSKGVKVDKLFRSDKFGHKNDQIDISSVTGASIPEPPAKGNGTNVAAAKKTGDDDLPF